MIMLRPAMEGGVAASDIHSTLTVAASGACAAAMCLASKVKEWTPDFVWPSVRTTSDSGTGVLPIFKRARTAELVGLGNSAVKITDTSESEGIIMNCERPGTAA